jgi:subtilisin family serine protease
VLAASLLLVAGCAAAQDRKTVHSIDDLPHRSYPLSGSVADLLAADAPPFEAMGQPMRAEIDTILRDYDVTDNATVRKLLQARLGLQIASGHDDASALATIEEIRRHEDKDPARLASNLAPQAFVEARLQTPAAPGTCPAAFPSVYAAHLAKLPWDVAGATMKNQKAFAQLATPNFITGYIGSELQPMLDGAHALPSGAAWQLLAARVQMDVVVRCSPQMVAALSQYVRAHEVQQPDIWAARDVDLASRSGLTPVNVAIWDSGVDPSLFPHQLLELRGERVPPLAYDAQSRRTTGDLLPLTAEQRTAYPTLLADEQGISDLQSGIDSAAAGAVRQRLAGMSREQSQAFFHLYDALSDYMHGTHVAGIAAAGNPAVRLVSARVTYDSPTSTEAPTDASLQRLAASYDASVAWFRSQHVRVVNMSWWDVPAHYEQQLERARIGKDADERKRLARHYFDIERDALRAALASAPDILFVTIAGNNNSDNAFEETIPSSFRLANLVVVGAVDQAGDQTSFTSTGQNIAVYADGFQVESVVPGGAKVRMSGTSMAAPAVSNLAAKLLAIRPGLSPQQTIALIVRSADAGASPGILRIDPKKAVAMLEATPQ